MSLTELIVSIVVDLEVLSPSAQRPRHLRPSSPRLLLALAAPQHTHVDKYGTWVLWEQRKGYKESDRETLCSPTQNLVPVYTRTLVALVRPLLLRLTHSEIILLLPQTNSTISEHYFRSANMSTYEITSKPNSFRPFSRLPTELRLYIWELAVAHENP
jgi:hypothetical protein